MNYHRHNANHVSCSCTIIKMPMMMIDYFQQLNIEGDIETRIYVCETLCSRPMLEHKGCQTHNVQLITCTAYTILNSSSCFSKSIKGG